MAKRRRGAARSFFGAIIIIGIIGFFLATGVFLLWASTLKTPDLSSFQQRKITQSTKIYDRTGEVLLFDVHENVQRTLVPFEDISRHIKNASVAIEDAEFYTHSGIRPLRTLKAILDNFTSGDLLGGQGGSTITQQVIKNSVLTSEKKISRKLKEWVLAVKLEQSLSKEQILELYLNETPYGGNLYGIEEASRSFFSKSATELTLAESSYLAALPQAPTFYSPYGNNKDKLEERKNLVLEQMFRNGFISREEYEEAQEEQVVFEPTGVSGIRAPHFVMFIREYLAQKYGDRALEERGFRVITTLNHELQQIAEEVVLRFALENVEKFDAENAGLIAIDPKTGQILTMVGSRDYFSPDIDGNFNVTLSHRQPGSAFKPFVYATALSKGFTPETIVFDVQTQFSTTCEIDNLTNEDTCYSPGNYDEIFRGPVTFRNALAQSINIPAVKVLYLAGLGDSLQTARSMGITSLIDINRYGLTLVLGGGEVSLIDITSAYGVFANEGVRHPYTGILRIEDSEGNIIEEYKERPIKVLDSQVALQISDMLSDNEARTPAFGSRSQLYFEGRDVAAKTGTTNDVRDAWIIGYTPTLAAGAWAGNNDNSPMKKKVAGFIIAPLWNAFMQEALKIFPDEKFRTVFSDTNDDLQPILRGHYEGGDSYIIDTVSGKLATVYTPLELREERVIADVHSILYWINKDAPRGERPKKPELDPQFEAWERGVSLWKETNEITGGVSSTTIPTEFDDVHRPEFRPVITIQNPVANALYSHSNRIDVRITTESKFPLSRVDIFVNGVFAGTTSQSPFSYSLSLGNQDLNIINGLNTLKVIGYDTVLNKGEREMRFTVDQ